MSKRMSGYDAFVKMADLREEFLDEAYLPALFPTVTPPPKKKPLLAPLWGFLGSHTMAAALCGVLALGVVTAVIALTPLNPFRDPPPVTEPPTEETSDPAETPPASEEASETEAETEEIQEPYELIFTSNGDGSCKVSDIVINPAYHENFTLMVPATSPEGERVVTVENPGGFTYVDVPHLLLPEDYNTLIYRIRSHFGRDDYYTQYFESYYSLKSLSSCTTEEQREALIAVYPWVQYTDFYILDETTVESVELAKISDRMIQPAYPEYIAYEAEKRLEKLVEEHGLTLIWDKKPYDPDLFRDNCRYVSEVILADGIETVGEGAFRHVRATSLTLPAGLTEIGDSAFQYCRSLAQVQWPTEGTLRRIGQDAFVYCSSLTELFLTGNGLTIGTSAFSYNGIVELTLGVGVTELSEYAFFECYDLESVYVGDGVTVLETSALPLSRNPVRLSFGENCRLSHVKEYGMPELHPDTVLPRSLTRIEKWGFSGGEASYPGTVAEWEAIDKDEAWSYTAITIHCTDGDVIFEPSKP